MIFAVLLAGCGKDGESKADAGMQALEKADYSTAQKCFADAIDAGENLKSAYRGLGMSYLAQADYAKAMEAFGLALAESNGIVESMDIDISYYYAVAQYKSGDAAGAIDTYDSIIAISPAQDDAYYMRGKVKLMSGDKAGANADYKKAVEIAPKDYDHYLRICEDLKAEGYESEGEEYIRMAMEGGGKLSDYQRGVFEYYLGSYTEARNDLEKAKSGKETEDLTIYLGKTYEALGDISYALTIYETYLQKNPTSAQLYSELALMKIDQQDYEGALQTVESGLALGSTPFTQSLMFSRIVANEYLLNFDTAASLMAEYLTMYPDDETAKRENEFLSTR